MDVLIVLVFVSIVLVCGALVLFFVALHQRDFEHSERLSLMPLAEPPEDPADAEELPSTRTTTGRPAREQP